MSKDKKESERPSGWRGTLYHVIYEAETPAGKAFDVALLVVIVASLVIVSLESVRHIAAAYGPLLKILEWVVTILFTIEYCLRLICVNRPSRYAFSFFGIIDLISILPTFASLFFTGTQTLMVVRALRLLRIFRVLKLGHFLGEANLLANAIRASRNKIIVFLFTILVLVMIFGALMYLVEGGEGGFTSIPQGMYWAIVTMTTVGYGDVAPVTTLGKFFASFIMIAGYGIIAIPTGIVTVELGLAANADKHSTRVCPSCTREDHKLDSIFCRFCGARL